MVRTIVGAYVLGMIYKQLREARKNYENSPDSLGKILTFNQKSLLGNHQLIGLSQNLHQLYSFRIELLNNVLRKIVQEICSAIDNEIKSIPIDEAVSILIDFYCINTKIKTKFQTIRQEMSRERKNLLAFFEYTADKAYKSAQTEQDVQHLQEYLVTLLGQNTTVLASTLFKNKKFRLERAARLITMSRTKEESLELLKMNYMLDLALPGQSSLFSLLFELQALQRTIEEEIE